MLLRELHPLNILEPISVTLSGITIFLRGVLLNAKQSIVFTPFPITMLLIEEFINAPHPILVTLSGIVMFVRLLQPENA